MKKPLVSLIIPVHNGGKTLNQCLNSVLNQDYKNYEVIVIDNNSTDNTKEIIESFQKKNKKIIYVFEKKIGRGRARNTGINKAKGDLILMTDSDCIVPSNWIKEMAREIEDNKEQAIIGFEEYILDNYWTRNIQKADEEFIGLHLNKNHTTTLDTKNFAIKSDIIKKFMFDESLKNSEDYDLALRIRNKVKVKFNPNIRVKHFHKNSFLKWMRLQFNRAYWVSKIYKKHKNELNFENEIMTKGFYKDDNLSIPQLFFQIIMDKNLKNKFFLISSLSSWKLGLLWGIITK
jgi:glycosyltransferase involved in cell wall biosynthesis